MGGDGTWDWVNLRATLHGNSSPRVGSGVVVCCLRRTGCQLGWARSPWVRRDTVEVRVDRRPRSETADSFTGGNRSHRGGESPVSLLPTGSEYVAYPVWPSAEVKCLWFFACRSTTGRRAVGPRT